MRPEVARPETSRYAALMGNPFANPTYRRLFGAQVLSLLGSGLTTVALGLLTFELAGAAAGAALGTALFIKMIAYVGLSPVAGALAGQVPRRGFLVSLDLIRAAFILFLPFVTQLWQVYALILLFQAASALFTPTYQATLPDVLPDEETYTRALSLSRLAYELETLLSPVLAGALLLLVSFHWLFLGTALGFLGSALLILAGPLPEVAAGAQASFARRLTWGVQIYMRTPRLRGLLALTFAVAAGGAFVLVNTVVLVRGTLERPESNLAWALGAYGAGAMLAALVLPHILKVHNDRRVMILGTILHLAALGGFAAVAATIGATWALLLICWSLAGLGASAVLTPVGRLLRRSAHTEDRPALFAAQFALSHACWLVAYPLAGFGGVWMGLPAVLAVLMTLGALGLVLAWRVWPADTALSLPHQHPDLPSDHPHLAGHQGHHSHPFIIDADHPHWPVER